MANSSRNKLQIPWITGIISTFDNCTSYSPKDTLSKWKLDYYTRLSYGFKVPLTLIYAPLQYLLKNYDQLTNTDVKRMLHTMSGNVFKLSEQVSKLMEFKKVSLCRNLEPKLKFRTTNSKMPATMLTYKE